MWVVNMVRLALLFLLAVRATLAAPVQLTFDPAASEITFSVPTTLHLVHGTFRLVRGAILYDSATGSASGEIVIDVTSGDSGNGSRDKRMHSVVLESSRYPEAVFRIDRAEGEKNLKVHGTLKVHGSAHELTLPVQVSAATGRITATGAFSLPYTAWGMKDASQFLLKVNPEVQVTVKLIASPR